MIGHALEIVACVGFVVIFLALMTLVASAEELGRRIEKVVSEGLATPGGFERLDVLFASGGPRSALGALRAALAAGREGPAAHATRSATVAYDAVIEKLYAVLWVLGIGVVTSVGLLVVGAGLAIRHDPVDVLVSYTSPGALVLVALIVSGRSNLADLREYRERLLPLVIDAISHLVPADAMR